MKLNRIVNIRLDAETYEQIKALAGGESLSGLIRSFVGTELAKREIERRGWSWMATGSKSHHEFAIWAHVRLNPDGSWRTPAGFAPEIGRAVADTEEIAGCLALKAALEASDAI